MRLSLGKHLLIGLCSISAGIQMSLSLFELGQVQGSNLLCLLNLLLVGADLALELVNQSLGRMNKCYLNLLHAIPLF